MRKGFERITMIQQCTPEKYNRDTQKDQDSTRLPDQATKQMPFQDENNNTTIQKRH
jgi:hypothetical protein